MKHKFVKRMLSMLLAGTMMLCGLTGCGGQSGNEGQSTDVNNSGTPGESSDASAEKSSNGNEENQGAGEFDKTILWLSNISSGIAYDNSLNYAQAICQELRYNFKVAYGDKANDPAGNLTSVKNAMTSDVVAIIASQDGGIKDILSEYPDLYVCGFNCDMRSVYAEDGSSAESLGNEKFLGTIVDGHADGTITGQERAQAVIDRGYKKVSVISFPGYAYPNLEEAEVSFRQEIEAYNATAAEGDQIEIVGDTEVLAFMPLAEDYFMDEEKQDLDAIVALCAGILFVYPTMKSAAALGSCSPDTKLITGGFEDDGAIVADIGEDGVIQYISFSPAEDIAFSIIMIDNALNGGTYSDYPQGTAETRVDPIPYVIDSKEDIDNVMTKSMAGTADVSLAQLSIDEIKNLCTRFNADATWADLVSTFQSEQISVDALKDR